MISMKLQKRAYEERAVRNLRKLLAEHQRVIAVSPTGSGKTVIASMLIKKENRWKKVLWLAHRVTPIIRIKGQSDRVAIHGTFHENPAIQLGFPDYREQLTAACISPAQVAAWLDGDWDYSEISHLLQSTLDRADQAAWLESLK